MTQVLPSLWLCAVWQEKTTRDPFTLLEVAVKVLSLATSFASFGLSTAVPVWEQAGGSYLSPQACSSPSAMRHEI